MFTGNRGILHRDGVLATERWRSKLWIICSLDYKSVRRAPMSPGTWTELFFLDEATALAAGHRSCALCRRDSYNRFRSAWLDAFGVKPSAAEIDAILHSERVPIINGTRPEVEFLSLPIGAFVEVDGDPIVRSVGGAHRWSFNGYEPIDPPIVGNLLTPPSVVRVLGSGYEPVLHPTCCIQASK